MYPIDLFSILFIIYFLQVILHFILCYQIMKSKKIISGLMDFMMKANSALPLLLQIFLGKEKDNSLLIKLFRANLMIALMIFISMILLIIWS